MWVQRIAWKCAVALFVLYTSTVVYCAVIHLEMRLRSGCSVATTITCTAGQSRCDSCECKVQPEKYLSIPSPVVESTTIYDQMLQQFAWRAYTLLQSDRVYAGQRGMKRKLGECDRAEGVACRDWLKDAFPASFPSFMEVYIVSNLRLPHPLYPSALHLFNGTTQPGVRKKLCNGTPVRSICSPNPAEALSILQFLCPTFNIKSLKLMSICKFVTINLRT